MKIFICEYTIYIYFYIFKTLFLKMYLGFNRVARVTVPTECTSDTECEQPQKPLRRWWKCNCQSHKVLLVYFVLQSREMLFFFFVSPSFSNGSSHTPTCCLVDSNIHEKYVCIHTYVHTSRCKGIFFYSRESYIWILNIIFFMVHHVYNYVLYLSCILIFLIVLCS